ncbi:MAG: N-acetylmuramic acid 6-phosphate etherase [Bryobacteraceae bacterium]|nr:N-acetylmuramic acid 6-phosphate etherase [Bryobacteraceae bacterium]MCX7603706.1 N-acetylmuramic acid 6-phosphate etherase [Bryobacteraceae bacterium]
MQPPIDLSHLTTEQRNPRSHGLDAMPTVEMLRVFNEEDRTVAEAVARALPAVAALVDAAAEALAAGGRLFYIGAGTSGRLGVLDASECPPTFNVPEDLVTGLIAGGDHALRHAVEGVEDRPEEGAADLERAGFRPRDFLVGIAASGRTPYVLGAVDRAAAMGAPTGGISCCENAELSGRVRYPVEVVTGPEVIAGSTRLKAGTATKMVLNMISSGVMVRLGLVYSNLMVNVQPRNAKLVDRAQRIIMEVAQVERERAARALEESGMDVRRAIVMARLGVGRDEAEQLLARAGGRLRAVIG